MEKFSIFLFIFIILIVLDYGLSANIEKCKSECFTLFENVDILFECSKKLYRYPKGLKKYSSYQELLSEDDETKKNNLLSFLNSFRYIYDEKFVLFESVEDIDFKREDQTFDLNNAEKDRLLVIQANHEFVDVCNSPKHPYPIVIGGLFIPPSQVFQFVLGEKVSLSKQPSFVREENSNFVISPYHFHQNFEFAGRINGNKFARLKLDTGANVCGEFVNEIDETTIVKELEIYSYIENSVVRFKFGQSGVKFYPLLNAQKGEFQKVSPDIILGWDCFLSFVNTSFSVYTKNQIVHYNFTLHDVKSESIGGCDEVDWKEYIHTEYTALVKAMIKEFKGLGKRGRIALDKEKKEYKLWKQTCTAVCK